MQAAGSQAARHVHLAIMRVHVAARMCMQEPPTSGPMPLSKLACLLAPLRPCCRTCRALGFNTAFTRPDWLLISVLPVPPPPVRPSVMMDSSAR